MEVEDRESMLGGEFLFGELHEAQMGLHDGGWMNFTSGEVRTRGLGFNLILMFLWWMPKISSPWTPSQGPMFQSNFILFPLNRYPPANLPIPHPR